jgi:hypothetical protein
VKEPFSDQLASWAAPGLAPMIPDGPCGFAIPDEASLLLLSTGEVVARVQTRRVDPE